MFNIIRADADEYDRSGCFDKMEDVIEELQNQTGDDIRFPKCKRIYGEPPQEA